MTVAAFDTLKLAQALRMFGTIGFQTVVILGAVFAPAHATR